MNELPKKVAISVILPFYKGDDAEHLAAALKSLEDQTLRAEEIVLIQDGPVGEALNQLVTDWKKRMPEIHWLVRKENGGLSAALNSGIEVAKNEWLARMDADDICLPVRFEKQWKRIQEEKEIAIIGSWIEEFDEQMEKSIAIRRLPAEHDEILKYARWRCPFNHMTVMYRRSALMKLGMYKNYGAVGDDYELWARFLMNGYRSANLLEVLVKARAGEGFFSDRRRGMKYLKNEIKEINDLYKLGLLNAGHYAFHFLVKAIVRLSPKGAVRFFYKLIRWSS
jgi:glycosyltransferase involved in cell wall biosynthesis